MQWNSKHLKCIKVKQKFLQFWVSLQWVTYLCFHNVSFSWYEISANGSLCTTSLIVSSSFCRMVGVSYSQNNNTSHLSISLSYMYKTDYMYQPYLKFLAYLFAENKQKLTSRCDLLSLVVKKWASSSYSYSWGCTTGKANLSNSISRQAVSFSSGLDPIIKSKSS